MRAVIAPHPGPPEVLRTVDLPYPRPGAGQVVVAVEAASVTFVDTQRRAGTAPGPAPDFPLVPGNGVGGTIEAVAHGVDPGWLGTRVVASTGGRGGYASRALAATADLHRVPAAIDLCAATALLADGRTALGLVKAARIGPGETVAVTAAAGGVGGLLVQLARNAGARVVALAGAERKLAHARSLGADATVSYRDADWPAVLSEAVPDGVDVAFDGVGGHTSRPLFERVVPGGRYLPHGAASGSWGDVDEQEATGRGVTLVPLTALGSPEELSTLVEEALALAADGVIRAVVGQTFPLDAAAEAHAAIESRATVGKTLLLTRGVAAGDRARLADS